MNQSYQQGLISALLCSFLWGVMPIYWRWLRPIDSIQIIFYRIFLVAVVCFVLAVWKYGWKDMWAPLKDKKVVARYILAGIIITANWSIYIWAINADFVIQTCIGYYIEPLVVCLFGMVLFHEKLDRYKLIALLFALSGVAVVIGYYKEVPLIALLIAGTFSTYAALKKNFQMPPVLSLLYETVFLAPPALAVILYIETTGQGALSVAEPWKFGLLLLCGILTAVPLLLFANAANKINLFVLGLTEYIGPTITLMLGIFLFREPFDMVQLVAFAIIWIGLIFFSYGEFKHFRQLTAGQEDEEAYAEE